MKIERTKNSIRGITSGYLNKTISLLLPFIVQTVFINCLGMEYLGLNSLFVSILNILNLAELGVGSAISFSMYNSIARNDKNEICALINVYKKLYRIIGLVVLGIGIALMPFLNYLCDMSEIPNGINVYIIFLMYLGNTSLSYLLYAYNNSLFNAHQKTNVINGIEIFVKIVLSIGQIFVLLFFKNYYIYLLILLLTTLLKNILLRIMSKKYYPNYIPKGDIDSDKKKEIFKKVKALFCYQIGAAVLVSVDSIVISKYLGLNILGKYNSYYFIITALFGFLQMTANALLAGIGNSIETETIEKNYNDFKKLNALQLWVVCFCSVCLICLYQNFIYIWIGGTNMLPFTVVALLTIDFFVWRTLDIVNLYKNAIGLWEYDQYRPLVAAVFNLVLNITLVHFIGIYGVIISTIISIVLIIFPWSTYVLFSKYFKKGYKEFLIDCLKNSIITFIIISIVLSLCTLIENITIINFFEKLFICIVVSNVLYLIFNNNNQLLKDSILWIFKKIKLIRIKKLFEKTFTILGKIKYSLLLIGFALCIALFWDINNEMTLFKNNIESVHISIDDTIFIFQDLSQNSEKYSSIFDNGTLSFLNRLHEKYDSKFSLYVFYEQNDFDLSKATDKYRNEFEENKDWLKFGFHSLSPNSKYDENDSLLIDYKKTINQLSRIVGEESITKTIRLEKYLLNKDNLIELQNSEYKIDGLFGSDSRNRKNYYLNKEQDNLYFESDIYEDNYITIYNTDIRLENHTISVINKKELQDKQLIVFTHEWQLYNYNTKLKLEKVCFLASKTNKEYIN